MKRIIGHIVLSSIAAYMVIFQVLLGQPYTMPAAGVDVLHYEFALGISEGDDNIGGTARLRIQFKQAGIQTLALDLKKRNPDSGEKGMIVEAIFDSLNSLEFDHQDSRLLIQLDEPTQKGEIRSISIIYRGIPADGLIIGKNKYGDRTFFGDNWPNRAQNWLPVVDHPADKATVEFLVSAPQKYQVVANGRLVEAIDLQNGRRLSHWKTEKPIPTKVMVMGAAEFAVEQLGIFNGVPVSSWVYPRDKEKGFYDYEVAIKVLDYFEKYIGSYPYAKLANVQSKTRFGGMENASNIFYSEESVTGDRSSESLIAHEVAHQWFGNSASEADWPHIWLSEGFATYFAAMYMEDVYGPEKLKETMAENREVVLKRGPKTSVVPTEIPNLMFLLNANSYQKGGWVLHMLRGQLGDSLFQAGVRAYYDRYKHSNATTDDLRQVLEEISGQDLEPFFQQWLHRAGNPVLTLRWDYDASRKKAICIFNQSQSGKEFSFPLKLHFLDKDGEIIREEICKISDRKHRFEISQDQAPATVLCDPNVEVLVDINIAK